MKAITKSRIWRGRSARKALPAPGDAPPSTDLAEMSFLEHLEEFRWALIKGFLSILIVTIICSFYSKWIIDVLLMGPATSDFFVYRWLGMSADNLVLQNRTITGQFFAHIGTILAVGVVLGSPLFVFFMWRFIEPGLYPNEKQGLRFAAAFATLFFMVGIGFGYCVVTPFALQFFANYQISGLIVNEFDITKYFGMVTFWAFGAGVLFELPVVVYFLSKIGILTPTLMRKYRKYAIIVTLILGAFFTPPDPVSQVLVAIPLLVLYELSIHIAARVTRRREKELELALA
jgi:sec-independent protein translocase protein TatC